MLITSSSFGRVSRAVIAAAVMAIVAASSTFAAPGDSAPKIDKQKLENYLRYAEAYSAKVKFVIDDPAPSPFRGYFRVLVHLSNGPQRLDRVYYVTLDGQHFVNGSIWDLNESPFLDNLQHLPSDGPSFGPENASVTMVVFSDFECPYCREFAKTMRDNVPKKYPNDVRVIFEDFPLESIHKWARAAAEASHCVGDQKPEAFWVFHDWIYDHQGEVNESNLREKTLAIAKEQNLDLSKISSCIDTHATAAQVNQSVEAGQSLQVQQTPTIFVNGRTISGAVPWNTLDTVIQLELNKPKDVPGAPASKCCEVTIPTVIKK
ncbi:MAG: thioredoxin domain-containing protein [Bryobacteraceae bacterium]